jgi:arsenite-transporting ATPase
LWNKEIIGQILLAQMAEEIYGEDDPSQIYCQEKPIEITSSDGDYYLFLRLPFADKKDLDIWVKGDELIIQYKNYKRNIALPRALASLELKEVELKDKVLKVRFGGDNNE